MPAQLLIGYGRYLELNVDPVEQRARHLAEITLDDRAGAPAFVRRIPEDTLAAAIVKTVLALGHSMNVPVLAEGIETEEQLRFLIDEGCNEGQGYLFAKPVPLAQIPDVMAKVLQRVGKPAANLKTITAAA